MGCIKLTDQSISARVAKQMRVGIIMGELAYNLRVKGDIKAARRVMIDASKSSKYTYLSALHTLANNLGCKPSRDVV